MACCKKEVELRLATLILLMISDADVLFSFLFLHTLYGMGFGSESGDMIFKMFFVSIIAGQITYVVGICYYGPKQKERTAKMVLNYLRGNKVESKMYKKQGGNYVAVDDRTGQVKIDSTSRVRPLGGANSKRFDQLDVSDKVDRDNMQVGLQQWGVNLWENVAQRNRKSEMKTTHGLPFIRLARYGFMAEISPMDLGGIINANTLYTFSCGAQQLMVGLIIVEKKMGDGTLGEDAVLTLLPWCISFLSFLLSLVNTFKDFAGSLVAYQSEMDMCEQVCAENETEMGLSKAAIKEELIIAIARIDAQYPPPRDQDSNNCHSEELKREEDNYEARITALNDLLKRRMMSAITHVRSTAKAKGDAITGKMVETHGEDDGKVTSALADMHKTTRDEGSVIVMNWYLEEFRKLDVKKDSYSADKRDLKKQLADKLSEHAPDPPPPPPPPARSPRWSKTRSASKQ